MWIRLSQLNIYIYIYIQLFAFQHHCILQKKPWLTSMVMSSAELSPFICNKREWTKARKGRELQLVSFGGQIDREAVNRMSSRHQMISLRNLIN